MDPYLRYDEAQALDLSAQALSGGLAQTLTPLASSDYEE
jgi:hypothetical protein